VRDDVPFLRGYNLAEAAEAEVGFGAILLLAFTGTMPTPAQARMANIMLVMGAAHGISPSGAVSRILAASGVPIQVSIAGAALSIGDYHGGAGEQLAEALQDVQGADEAATVAQVIASFESRGERVPGFGHPMHADGDPRAPHLLGLADRLAVSGDHVSTAVAIGRELSERKGRDLPLNINGAWAAILSDLGVPWQLMRVFTITSRAPVLGALAVEEVQRERRWRKTASEDTVVYDGPPPRELPEPWRASAAPVDGTERR
jgi:citrate synthase